MTTPDYTSSSGMGIPLGNALPIDVPITLPAALGEVSAAIATGVSDAGEPDPISVRRRWAVVTAINTDDSTVDINLGGVVVPHVAYDASYHPALDETVQVNVVDTDITVIGPTANATYVAYIRREGTIVKVNTAAGAPGTPTSVNVTLDDAQTPVTVLNVPYVSEYFPTVNDSVMLGQGTNTSVYLVLGAVNRSFRRPTGDIEPSLLSVAKPNTLLCQGQAVGRTTYAALWAWVQINALVGANLPFGTGDGSTTFTLPDFRGRVPVGVGTLGADTYNLGGLSGAARVTLAMNQMPSHDHNVTVADHAAHSHTTSGTTSGSGTHTHGGTTGADDRDHGHSGTTGNDNANHTHGGTTGNADRDHGHGFSTGGGGGHAHAIQVAYASGGHDHAGPAFQDWVSQGPGTGVTNGGPGALNASTMSAGDHGHSGTTGGENSTHAHVFGTGGVSNAHQHGFTTGGENTFHLHGFTTAGGGDHTHTFTGSTNSAGGLVHSVGETAMGGSTAVDVRPPSIAINWIVWT